MQIVKTQNIIVLKTIISKLDETKTDTYNSIIS